MLRNLLLLLVSSLATLVVLEGAIRLEIVPLPDHFDSDGWWRERWSRRGPIEESATFARPHPTLGWVPIPDLRDRPLDGARISTNSQGWRGRREYPRQPGRGLRAVALGDSYTFGQCVGDDESFPARLEALLPDAEVLNMGVMGWGQDQMLVRLREEGLAWQPDVVLLSFHSIDMARNGLSFREWPKPRFRLRDGELVLDNVPLPSPEELRTEFRLRLANYAIMLRDVLRENQRKRERRELALATLRAAARETRAAGARFVLVYLPKDPSLLERDPEPFPVHKAKVFCDEVEDVEGVTCVSPLARILAEVPPGEMREHLDCHYSPLLHDLIAREVAAVLADVAPAPRAAPPRPGAG